MTTKRKRATAARSKSRGASGRGRVPRAGSLVYVDTRLYLGHGVDDFQGGLCKVAKARVETVGETEYLNFSVTDTPRRTHCIARDRFAEDQARLRRKFGRRRGYPLPDISIEHNDECGFYTPTTLATEGLGIVERALAEHPRTAPLWWVKAECLMVLGRRAEAEEALRRTVRLAPKRHHAWMDLGRLLLAEDHREEARDCFATVVQLCPGNRVAAELLTKCDRDGQP